MQERNTDLENPQSGATSSSTTQVEEDEELALNNWDKWLENDEELDDSKAMLN